MESVVKPARAKRGCLWYLGIAAAGAFGLLVVFIVAIVLSPDEPGQSRRSIPVSAQQQTYLEVVTHSYQDRRNGEGFLADYVNYTVLAVYYTKAGGWLQAPQRILIFCGGEGSNPSNISIRQRKTGNSKVRFEIKRRINFDEVYEVVNLDLKDYDIYPDGKFSSEALHKFYQARDDRVKARLKAAKDSVVLAVFVPPAVFPEDKVKQTHFENDCRSEATAPKPASELLNIPRRLSEALQPVP